MSTGVRNIALAACIAPSAVMNVLPRASAVLENGHLDAQAAGIIILQAVSVATMAAVPFGFIKARNWLIKVACLAFGAALLSVNLFNAIEVAGHIRELAAAPATGVIAKATGLKSRIADLRKSRAEVPFHTFTGAAAVTAAESAVKSAQTARDAECRYYVSKGCREKEDALSDAQKELGRATGQRELTDRADKLDGQIAAAEKEFADLGPIPTHGDATAAKVAAIFGLSEIWVHENWATWLAVVVELLASLGPVTWIEALGQSDQRVQVGPAANGGAAAARETLPTSPLKTVRTGILPTPSTPAKAKKARKCGAKDQTALGGVREFFEARTASHRGNEIRCNEVRAAYEEWCHDRGIDAVTLTRFGTIAKGELGITYVERSKRGYYVGIALTETPRLRVVTS